MENEISRKVIGAAIEVHKVLGGPGLLESIYEDALMYELTSVGLRCQKQVAVPVRYKDIVVRDPLFLDILVEDRVILEVKATEQDHSIFRTQLLTYLRLTNLYLGLLLNFGKMHMKDGISRVVN
jgi:GxxExxY protein